jgi:hypothetical protein
LAVNVNESKHVTGIYKVRVLDLGIDIPDFGPIPGIMEKRRSDVPESVANLNDILIGSAFGERNPIL